MDISAINNVNPNFNGRIITKGPWPTYLKNVFTENPEIKKLAAGESNIIGKLSVKPSKFYCDGKSYITENSYKIKVYAEKEKTTFMDKIKRFFGLLPSINITKNHHGISTIETRINEKVNAQEFSKKLGIKI